MLDGRSWMPKSYWLRILLSLFALFAVLLWTGRLAEIKGMHGLNVRAQVIYLKITGKIPEIDFSELFHLLPPGGGFKLDRLVQTQNPLSAIEVPSYPATETDAGRAIFEKNCSTCHGQGARGAAAPALVGRPLSVGAGDWAIYRTITDGLADRGMPALGLSWRDKWRIISYLRKEERGLSEKAGVETFAAVRNVPASAIEASASNPDDWLTYSGSYTGARHSSLSQINAGNVSRMRLMWMHQVPNSDPRFETTPLAVGGVLFISLPQSGVQAIDGETGKILWTYDRKITGKVSVCCGLVNRGVAILDNRVFLATVDAHMIALDARNGRVLWDTVVDDPANGYALTSAPLALRDIVVIGTAGGEFGALGHIDAYDARTGKRRWRFDTIPRPGQPGSNTWSGDSWKKGGGPAWLTGTYDPQLNLVYWGTGNPSPDFNGDERLGDNLYTNSVVALDAKTGRMRWHFQFTPHDVHDWDAAQIPVLANDKDGRRLLMTANKNGFYYILDRETGRYIRAKPFTDVNWAKGLDGRGRPIIQKEIAPSRNGTLVYPGAIGGTNWWPPSYDPAANLFFVQTVLQGSVFYKGAQAETANSTMDLGGGAIGHPGRVEIRALDGFTGEIKWRHEVVNPLPSYPYFIGGLLSTAGNIVFGGAQDELVALDSHSGKALWRFHSGPGVHAAPMTYTVKGKQRITVAVGHSILTFGVD